MTIWLYSGTPGSGKSYHATKDIHTKLRKRSKNRVIANFSFKTESPNFLYKDNSEITVEFLVDYASIYHKYGVEGQTLVVIDEAGTLFNCRDWGTNSKKRMDWIKFFSQHRKFGYNFVLIAQFDKMIDKQIRMLIEYETTHMKINNFFFFLPMTAFLAVEHWYGQRMKTGHQVIIYSKRIAGLYNSYQMFNDAEAAGCTMREVPAKQEGTAIAQPAEPPTLPPEITLSISDETLGPPLPRRCNSL